MAYDDARLPEDLERSRSEVARLRSILEGALERLGRLEFKLAVECAAHAGSESALACLREELYAERKRRAPLEDPGTRQGGT